ncbi:RsfA family transcriptional regulator [Peribacillus sp. JNUCC 23]|uniref:RsfA family transcriptional regulator n=1 Tax=Peribacillus sp. NPDC096379 TaxID=3364393 RepID=UPI0037FAC6DE
MSIARQDAWTQDEDVLLAEVVLRHIREGSTQLNSFEEVGKNLSRTAAACGFRWNSHVRKQYKSGIELAKIQRKENKKLPLIEKEEVVSTMTETSVDIPQLQLTNSTITMQDVVQYLTRVAEQTLNDSRDRQLITQEYDKLLRENEKLKHDNKKLFEKLSSVEDDYNALLQIMERARKLIVLEEDKKEKKVKFQMDKNGNLERVEK